MSETKTKIVEITQGLEQIHWHLKQEPVFCDIANPPGFGLVVRDARAFRSDKSLQHLSPQDPAWTDAAFLGRQKGYEVLVLEGWRIPERVYLKRKETL